MAGSANAAIKSAARSFGDEPSCLVVGYSTGTSPKSWPNRSIASSCTAGHLPGAANDGETTATRSPAESFGGTTNSGRMPLSQHGRANGYWIAVRRAQSGCPGRTPIQGQPANRAKDRRNGSPLAHPSACGSGPPIRGAVRPVDARGQPQWCESAEVGGLRRTHLPALVVPRRPAGLHHAALASSSGGYSDEQVESSALPSLCSLLPDVCIWLTRLVLPCAMPCKLESKVPMSLITAEICAFTDWCCA
jgi:hypothetical protein